jgi:hypothetical protein
MITDYLAKPEVFNVIFQSTDIPGVDVVVNSP